MNTATGKDDCDAFAALAQAWSDAASDLGIDVVCPFRLQTEGQEFQYPALIKHFGGRKGTLLIILDCCGQNQLELTATREGYYWSMLNVHAYIPYKRDVFVDTLNDWGWFGPDRLRPSWYTGVPWR